MDMMRALATPNMDVRKKTLDLALDLISARNIDEVRACLPACTPPSPPDCQLWEWWISLCFVICGSLPIVQAG